MLMADGQWLAGSLSGGCIESDALSTAWDRTEKGPVIVTYDASADEDVIWGFGLGCNGTIDVLLERVDQQCIPLTAMEQTIATRAARQLATIIASPDPSRIGE